MALSFPCTSRIIVIKKEWPKSTLRTGCMPLHPMLEVLWTMPVTWPTPLACLTLDHYWRISTRTGSPGIPHWRFQNSMDRICWRMRICKFNSWKPWWRQALPWSQILASPRASRMWIVASLWKTLCFPLLGESISILCEQHASVWSIQKQLWLLLKIPLTMIARIPSPCTQTTRPTTGTPGYLQFMYQARGSVTSKVCDGLAVAEHLRQHHPKDFEMLAKVNVTHSTRNSTWLSNYQVLRWTSGINCIDLGSRRSDKFPCSSEEWSQISSHVLLQCFFVHFFGILNVDVYVICLCTSLSCHCVRYLYQGW